MCWLKQFDAVRIKQTKDAGGVFTPTQSSDSDSGLGLDLAKVVLSLTDVYCLIFHP